MSNIHAVIAPIATWLELAGVAVIIIGVILATIRFLAATVFGRGSGDAYSTYRAGLGRGILLGLEILVGADIISTVTAPLTFESVGLLAAIVAIRTFLSVSLETEIEGRWPWSGAAREEKS